MIEIKRRLPPFRGYDFILSGPHISRVEELKDWLEQHDVWPHNKGIGWDFSNDSYVPTFRFYANVISAETLMLFKLTFS